MIAALTDRQPCAFLYGRVSDDKQIATGNSIPEQIARMDAYYKSRLADKGVVFGGVEYDDFGVSASKKGFDKRPAGKRIMAKLQPGDHVIVDTLDRIWRDPRDFENLLHWFKTHNITLHIVQMDIVAGSLETAGLIGELTIRIFVAIANVESRRNSERHLAHYAAARKEGRSISRLPPAGTMKVEKISEGKKRKFLEWDPQMRGIMAAIVEMRDAQGMSFPDILWEVERRMAETNHRPWKRSAFFKTRWCLRTIQYLYYVEIYYREHNITDTREIPPNVQVVASKYCGKKRRALRAAAQG